MPGQYESLEKGLYVIDKTRELGRMTVAILSTAPGWNKANASRYLAFLAQSGWLERVNPKGFPVYVLGHKVLRLAPDLKL
jgi:DNA-binding IclR family transcriptional regulator